MCGIKSKGVQNATNWLCYVVRGDICEEYLYIYSVGPGIA